MSKRKKAHKKDEAELARLREEEEQLRKMAPYIEYIRENAYEIGQTVNREFEKNKRSIAVQLIDYIRDILSSSPIHYRWDIGDCPYDYSGILIKDGTISLNQTIANFLEKEYTGHWEATFTSRYGMHYTTYGDALSYETLEAGERIMKSSVRGQLEKQFGRSFSDEEFDCITYECHDDVYDECLAFDFFSWKGAVDFAEIGDIKLSELDSWSNLLRDKEEIADVSLKSRCLGLTVQQIKDRFGAQFLEDKGLLVVEGVIYQLAIDAGVQGGGIVTDLWLSPEQECHSFGRRNRYRFRSVQTMRTKKY